MFVAKNQIFVFFACVAIGGIGGILFTFSTLIKFFIKNARLKILPDIAAFCVFSLFYVWVSFRLNFPSYRVYMTAGAIIGLFLYMKSFNITLALWTKKLYNITVKKFVALKIKRKESVKKNVKRRKRDKHGKIFGNG